MQKLQSARSRDPTLGSRQVGELVELAPASLSLTADFVVHVEWLFCGLDDDQ